MRDARYRHRPIVALCLLLCGGSVPAFAQTTAAGRDCLAFHARPPDISNEAAFRKGLQAWIEACKQAVQAEPDNARIKVSYARALSADGRRAEAIPLWRAAGAQGDAEALFEIYDTFKSYDRSDVTKPQLIKREEAERSLRKAAELGHPYSMWMLAVLLDRGSTVKRDAAGAIFWAEKAMANPPKDTSRADIEVRLGHFLAKSEDAQQKARGIAILEGYARTRGDAKAYLARALRSSDPVRARKLLEEGVRSYPGHAIPLLADMLIKGEGGPVDTARALKLLRQVTDVSAVKAALGQLYLEGKLVPRDLKEAVRLIRSDAVWSHESRLQVMGLLAANPDLRLDYPSGFLYDATEAAELGEPGALLALIDLKLSSNAQFADKAGACALVDRAMQQKLEGATERAKNCR